MEKEQLLRKTLFALNHAIDADLDVGGLYEKLEIIEIENQVHVIITLKNNFIIRVYRNFDPNKNDYKIQRDIACETMFFIIFQEGIKSFCRPK